MFTLFNWRNLIILGVACVGGGITNGKAYETRLKIYVGEAQTFNVYNT